MGVIGVHIPAAIESIFEVGNLMCSHQQGVAAGDGNGAAAAEEREDGGGQDPGWQEKGYGEGT